MRKFALLASVLLVGVGVVVQGQVAEPSTDWRGRSVNSLSEAGIGTAFPDGSFLAGDTLTGYQAAVSSIGCSA
jgi:hypothetical protein